MHTKHEINKLTYIIKSMMSKDFILHNNEGEDLRLTLDDREDLIMMINMRFANINPNVCLKIYGIPQPSLKEFKTFYKSDYDTEPDQKYRLKDEEISS